MMKRSDWRVVLLCLLLLASCATPTGEITSEPLKEIKLQTVWVANPQFAGVYVAMEKGFYEREGVRVSINEYDESLRVVDAIDQGLADFGIDGADQALTAQAEGKDIIAVAVINQVNPSAFASLAEKEIRQPSDLVDVKVGYLPDNTGTIFDTLVRAHGLDENRITRVPYSYDLSLLYDGTLDVIPIYIYDEPYILEKEGHPVETILAWEYGVRFYGDSLLTSERLIKSDPALVKGVVKATLDGWEYAATHLDEALDITLSYADEGYAEEDYARNILTLSMPTINTGDVPIGWMHESTWEEMAQTLEAHGQLASQISAEQAYTKAFLGGVQGVYDEGNP